MRLLKPKIIEVVDKLTGRRPRSLMGYNDYGFQKQAASFSGALNEILSDHEIKLLLIWAIISPSAAIAYLIWIKYPAFRLLAIPLFALSLVQFIGQWGGVYWMLQRTGIVG